LKARYDPNCVESAVKPQPTNLMPSSIVKFCGTFIAFVIFKQVFNCICITLVTVVLEFSIIRTSWLSTSLVLIICFSLAEFVMCNLCSVQIYCFGVYSSMLQNLMVFFLDFVFRVYMLVVFVVMRVWLVGYQPVTWKEDHLRSQED